MDCSGGTCSYLTPIDTSGTYPADQLYAGQKTLGDYYRENIAKCQQFREVNLAYDSLLRQFQGPESTWIRWLIKRNKGMIISDMLGRDAYGKSMSKGWLDRYISGDLPLHTGKEAEFYQKHYGEIPALPDWMRDYIIPVTTETEVSKGRGTQTKTSTSYTLRPLSPTAKLDAEQQNQLAGFLAWSKAGFPTKWSEDALIQMSDIERHWTPYTMESEAMFSKAPTKPKWATTFQR